MQNPTIRITLTQVTSYDYIKKDTLKEQFFEAILSLRYKATTIATNETTINGQTAYVQTAKTDDTFQNKPLLVSYYFVLLPINTEYCIEILCDAETKDWETYFPVFQAIISDIEFTNDIKKCHEAYDLYDEQMVKSLQKNQFSFQATYDQKLEKEIEAYMVSVTKVDESVFNINDCNFNLIWDETIYNTTQWGIDLNGQFYCNIVAQAEDSKRLKKQKILSDYNDEGEIKISFTYSGLYQNGLPKATLNVKEDKIKSTEYAGFTFDGKKYNLYFDGNILIDEKGVKVLGYLHNTTNRKIPVNVQIAFNVADLDWKKYHFSTLEELETAPDDLVEHISTKNSPRLLPQRWKRFKNLKTLFLGSRHDTSNSDLAEIPTWIGCFHNLESIVVSSQLLTAVPNELAKLTNLKRLSIFNTELTQLPDDIWQMPNLEHLSLAENKINHIPNKIALTQLKWLDLQSNQLTSLPKSLATLPNLKTVSLERNPWVDLPQNLEKIPTLNLEIEHKRAFFNFDYQGADGKGTTPWNDSVFYAKNDAELMQSVTNYWQHEAVKPYRKDLLELMKNP